MESEVLAAIIAALAALCGLIIGANLNRKQRTREELYSHKVNAYAKLAEVLAEIRGDFESLAYIGSGSDVVPFEQSRSPIEIDLYFRRSMNSNYLFFSTDTKLRTHKFADRITNSSKLTFNNSTLPDIFTAEDLRKNYEDMINECTNEIQHLYFEIGLNKV